MTNEFLRLKQEREFQTRVLAAVGKPKPSRLWAGVNSPIVLWFLTATLLSVGGAFFANNQQCISEGERLTTRWNQLSTEVRYAKGSIKHAIEDASDMADLVGKIDAIPRTYSEFTNKTLYELVEERASISQMIDFGTIQPWINDFYDKREQALEQLQKDGLPTEAFEHMLLGRALELLSDRTLPSLKKFVEKIGQREMWIDGIELSPNCGFWQFARRSITGERAPLLQYSGGRLTMDLWYAEGEEPSSIVSSGKIKPPEAPAASRKRSPTSSAPRGSQTGTRLSNDAPDKAE